MPTTCLCVPKSLEKSILALGAVPHPEGEPGLIWDSEYPTDERWNTLKPLIPFAFRPDIPPPFLRPQPLPRTTIGMTLKVMIEPTDWEGLKREIMKHAGYRCRVCGGRGANTPVDVDEVWAYDDQTATQRLTTVLALCQSCCDVHRWNRRQGTAQAAAIAHLAWVNRWSQDKAKDEADQAVGLAELRSRTRWSIDCTLTERKWGISLHPEAGERAKAANARILQKPR